TTPVHAPRGRQQPLSPATLVESESVDRLAGEVRSIDLPLLSLAIAPEEECTLQGADEEDDVAGRFGLGVAGLGSRLRFDRLSFGCSGHTGRRGGGRAENLRP